jgi:hypothetical protein
MGEKCTEPAEIEITPEMIEAGLGVLRSYYRRMEDDEGAVCAIYSAMIEKRRRTFESL